jgi:hypothetical protein
MFTMPTRNCHRHRWISHVKTVQDNGLSENSFTSSAAGVNSHVICYNDSAAVNIFDIKTSRTNRESDQRINLMKGNEKRYSGIEVNQLYPLSGYTAQRTNRQKYSGQKYARSAIKRRDLFRNCIYESEKYKKTFYFPFPISLFSASRYFSPVLVMISAGSEGAGARLFQSRVSR